MVGRVFDPNGILLRNVRVLLRSATGDKRAAKTDKFGVYRFENIARNRSYQLTPMHRLYDFTPRIVMVKEQDLTNLDFTAVP
jgi:hypothetical protein